MLSSYNQVLFYLLQTTKFFQTIDGFKKAETNDPAANKVLLT
jgi:hypothetical protein